jgi:hypothetical protein
MTIWTAITGGLRVAIGAHGSMNQDPPAAEAGDPIGTRRQVVMKSGVHQPANDTRTVITWNPVADLDTDALAAGRAAGRVAENAADALTANLRKMTLPKAKNLAAERNLENALGAKTQSGELAVRQWRNFVKSH